MKTLKNKGSSGDGSTTSNAPPDKALNTSAPPPTPSSTSAASVAPVPPPPIPTINPAKRSRRIKPRSMGPQISRQKFVTVQQFEDLQREFTDLKTQMTSQFESMTVELKSLRNELLVETRTMQAEVNDLRADFEAFMKRAEEGRQREDDFQYEVRRMMNQIIEMQEMIMKSSTAPLAAQTETAAPQDAGKKRKSR